MTQQADIDVQDQPLSKTWEGDWAKAQEQAESREEKIDDERKSTLHEAEGLDGSASESESSSVEDDAEASTSPQSGEEHAGGEVEDDGGQRSKSQSRRERREREAEPVDPPAEDDAELIEFKEKAEKLGYTFDDRQVTKQERISLRQERREMRQKLAEEKSGVVADLEKRVADFEEKYAGMTALKKAVDSDDLDGVASALGHKDWRALNTSFLNKTLSPEHREVQALKQKLKVREDNEAKAAKEVEGTRAKAALSAKEKEYKADLSDDIGDLAETHLAAFAKDPAFVQGVFRHQKESWDGVETLSTKEAAELAYKDAKGLFDSLSKFFGNQEATTSEKPASGATAEKTSRRRAPKTVSQRTAAEASPIDNSDELDEKAWTAKWSKRMDEAHRSGDAR